MSAVPAAKPPALHQRLLFDTGQGQVLDQTRRYLLLRADVLMGLFAELPEAARAEALRALGRSVTRHGGDSVRAYAAQPGVTPAVLLQTMADSAGSLGWGRWEFAPLPAAGAAPASSGLALQVHNSPFAAAATFGEQPACHAIAGMLEAVGAALSGGPCEAREVRCAAQAGPAAHAGPCRFELHSRDPSHPLPASIELSTSLPVAP